MQHAAAAEEGARRGRKGGREGTKEERGTGDEGFAWNMRGGAREVALIAALFAAGCAASDNVVDNYVPGWPTGARVWPQLSQNYNQAVDDALFMDFSPQNYWFYVLPAKGAQLAGCAVYINADLNVATGYQGSGTAQLGFDYMLSLQFKNNQVDTVSIHLAPCTFGNSTCLLASKISDLPFRTDPANNAIEIKVDAQLLSLQKVRNHDLDVGMLLIQTQEKKSAQAFSERLVPPSKLEYIHFYHEIAPYSLVTQPTQECAASRSVRGAVIFSESEEGIFWDERSYAQLFLSMQYQAMQAGVPVDRLTTNQLLALDSARMCRYAFVIMPAQSHAPDRETLGRLRKAVYLLIHWHSVSVITAGNFLTNLVGQKPWDTPVPGNSYSTMQTLFGLTNNNPAAVSADASLTAQVAQNDGVFRGFEIGEQIHDSSTLGLFTSIFRAHQDPGESAFQVAVIATQTVDQRETHPAIFDVRLPGTNMLGKTSGRIFHFSTQQMLANADIVWRVIDTAREHFRPQMPVVGLQLSRSQHLMATRVDMDQSRVVTENAKLYRDYIDSYAKPWYNRWDFVQSYFINIGNDPSNREYTNWNESLPLYMALRDLESEFGSHSYTHPDDINILSDAELDFEFGDAAQEIKEQLDQTYVGAAQPGAPESLRVARKMEQYHGDSYFSGGYSGVGAGFPGAFGFLHPESAMVYLAPNLYFDFSLIAFYKLSVEQSIAFWAAQLADMTNSAKQAIGVWPIHDYAPGNWGTGPLDWEEAYFGGGAGYEQVLFTSMIENMVAAGSEFLTMLDLSERIRLQSSASLMISAVPGSNGLFQVEVDPLVFRNTQTLGKMALSIPPGWTVKGWHAFNGDKLFLAETKTSVTIAPADERPSPVTHLISLPMRSSLVRARGNKKNLSFEVRGVGGVVQVRLAPGSKYTFSASGPVKITTSEGIVSFDFRRETKPRMLRGRVDWYDCSKYSNKRRCRKDSKCVWKNKICKNNVRISNGEPRECLSISNGGACDRNPFCKWCKRQGACMDVDVRREAALTCARISNAPYKCNTKDLCKWRKRQKVCSLGC